MRSDNSVFFTINVLAIVMFTLACIAFVKMYQKSGGRRGLASIPARQEMPVKRND